MTTNHTAPEANPLVGTYFSISRKYAKGTARTGIIVGQVAPGYFLVEFHDEDGQPTHKRAIPVKAMSDGWTFFDTEDQMFDARERWTQAYEDRVARRDA